MTNKKNYGIIFVKNGGCFNLALEIIYGPYLKGSEDYIFSNIKFSLQNSRKVLYIVPEQTSLQADKSVLSNLGEKFSHLTQTITFKRLAELINKKYSKEKQDFVTEEIKDLILFSVIKKHASRLKSLKNRSKNPDSILIFKDVITELKTHLIDYTLLLDIKDDFIKTSSLYDKITDLSLIMEEYDKYLKNNFSGYEDIFKLLTKNITENELFKDYEIYIDGFIHFSPSELEVIKALFKNCRNMYVTLLLDTPKKHDKGDLFYISSNTFGVLKEMAQSSQKSFICTCSDEKTNKNTLKIFNGEENKEKNIIAIDCKNPADEIRSVIYEIKKKTSEGYHYSDMCILSGTPDLYAPYTEKLLTASDIPFFMDKKVALSKNPVCKFFINMLSSVKENYHYEDISCFVKSISFMCDAFSEITLFETYISNFRIKKSVLLNKAEWKSSYEIAKLKNSFLIKNEKSIQKVYDKFIVPLAESFKPLKKKNKAEVYTNAIKAFIKETHFEKLLKSYIDTLSDFNEKQLYINAYNTFIRGVKHIEDILCDEEIEIGEYSSLISQMLEIYKIGVLPNTIDSVLVSDLERGRIKDKKIVFIIGFNDGVTPKNTTDTSYLSDIEREEFEKVSTISLPSSKWKNSSSFLALYRGVISAEDMLFVSKSLNNIDGEAISPSFIWNNLKNNASKYFVFEKNFINLHEATQYVIENRYNAFEDKRNVDAVANEVTKYKGELFWELEKMQEDGYFSPEKKVSKALIDTVYQKKLNTSVSRIEAYQKCSYSYFLRYLLKINAPEKMEYDFAKTGTIVHDVLDVFAKKMKEAGKDWHDISDSYIEDATQKLVVSQIEKNFPDCNLFSPKTKYLIKKLTRISKTALLYIKEHYTSGMFTPIGYEIPVNEEGVEPLSFSLSDGSVMEIYGKIDRADIFAGKDDTVFVRIIDYKSSSKNIDFALVKEGIRIQLLVYLQTLVKNGAEYLDINKILLPGAAFYMAYDHSLLKFDKKPASEEITSMLKEKFSLQGVVLNDERVLYAIDKELENNPNYKSTVADISNDSKGNIKLKNLLYKEQFSLLLEDCEAILKKTGNKILKGEFYIRPYKDSDKAICQYCDYKGICQFDKTVYPYKTVYSLGKDKYFEKRGDWA